MKKSIATLLVAINFGAGAYGQGSILLDNSSANNGITIYQPNNWFSGTYGLEVWVRNGTNFDLNSINQYAGVEGGLLTYPLLASEGFSLVATYANQVITLPLAGIIQLGRLDIQIVDPPGSSITIALAAWVGSGSSFMSNVHAVGNSTYSDGTGVVAFYTATSDYTQLPTPAPVNIAAGWDAANVDLIMAPVVPEPGTLTMMIFGAIAFVFAMRRGTRSVVPRAETRRLP